MTIAEFAKRYEITEFQAARLLRDLRKGDYPNISDEALDAFIAALPQAIPSEVHSASRR